MPRYALVLSVATKDRPELVSSGAGLASAVAVEAHGELGEQGPEGPIRARGYWENVWLRFRRDTFAIAGGVWILLVLLIGFVGAPIAAYFLGHGPNDITQGGLNPTTLLPVGPLTFMLNVPVAPW